MRAAIGVGFLAVAMVGCPDEFTDPFVAGEYEGLVLGGGCRGMSGPAEALPPALFANKNELVRAALAWEGDARCADASIAIEGAGVTTGTVQCVGAARALSLTLRSDVWLLHVDPMCERPLEVEFRIADCGADAGTCSADGGP